MLHPPGGDGFLFAATVSDFCYYRSCHFATTRALLEASGVFATTPFYFCFDFCWNQPKSCSNRRSILLEPAFFASPVAVKAGGVLLRQRRLGREHRRLAEAARVQRRAAGASVRDPASGGSARFFLPLFPCAEDDEGGCGTDQTVPHVQIERLGLDRPKLAPVRRRRVLPLGESRLGFRIDLRFGTARVSSLMLISAFSPSRLLALLRRPVAGRGIMVPQSWLVV